MNKLMKKITAVFLCICLISGYIPMAIAAEDIGAASVVINDSGTYTITGTAAAGNNIIITGGNPTVIFDNLNITATASPAMDIQSGIVTLILTGSSNLKGGKYTFGTTNGVGCAGIRVAEGATLIISEDSTGDLTVAGGDGAVSAVEDSGAGIGSNGYEEAFGTIIINGGTITVTGGTPTVKSSYVSNAGAGIGTGAWYTGGSPEDRAASGKIEINGGTILAHGGKGDNKSSAGGAAAIGSGAYNNEVGGNDIEIIITGGNVTAYGGMDAAGIGGASNVPSGPITISGGIVQAFGGKEDTTSAWGGAGIGGGDTGGYTQGITITGDSRVLAIGGGGGAGIGGGNNEGNWGGMPGDDFGITISGTAHVVAVGGLKGGAAVGSGRVRYDFSSMGGIINILDSATVYAYGGEESNAIGNGKMMAAAPTHDPAIITVENGVTLAAFTRDMKQPALFADTTIVGSAVLYSYTDIDGTAIAVNTVEETTTPLGLSWEWIDGSTTLEVSVSDGTSFFGEKTYQSAVYNWANLEMAAIPTVTLTYEENGGTGTAPVDANSPYAVGSEVTVLAETGLTKVNHVFKEWNTSADGTGTAYNPGDKFDIMADTTLYAIWTTSHFPYTVEYYHTSVLPINLIGVVAGTKLFAAGHLLTYADIEGDASFGAGWLNAKKPTSGYNNGAVQGGYPTISATVENNTVKVLYTVISEPTVVPGYEIKIIYKDENGGLINGTKVTSASSGGKYSVTAPEIEGYRYVSATVNGILTTNADIIIDAVYDNYEIVFVYEPIGGVNKPSLNRADHFWYIKGYPDNSMRPSGNITRAEVATIFYRLIESGDKENAIPRAVFSDIKSDVWYSKAVTYLYDCGIISGYEDGTFRPNNPITRAEIAKIACMFDDINAPGENKFIDVLETYWAFAYIASATDKGWIIGYAGGTFRPEENATRAEMVSLINRVLDRRVKLENILPQVHEWNDMQSGHWAYTDMIEAAHSHTYERASKEDYEIWLDIIGTGITD